MVLRFLIWGASSVGVIVLLMVFAYHSAWFKKAKNDEIYAIPEFVLELLSAVSAAAIGLGFVLARGGLTSDSTSTTLAIVAAVVVLGMALFYFAAGRQEDRIERLEQIGAERAQIRIATEINRKFIEELMTEDLSDIEIEDFDILHTKSKLWDGVEPYRL